jgi:hypothetical protein
MSIATKVAALLVAVRRQDIEDLPPAERQRFANLCRHVAAMAERQPGSHPRSGVLGALKSGCRPE